jgi:hypothetical protein
MMNIYRVDTTTNDEWEIIGGCYLVKAHNEVEAKEKVQKNLMKMEDHMKRFVIK